MVAPESFFKDRSSRLRFSVKKAVLKNLSIFTSKYLLESLFNKAAGLQVPRPGILLKRDYNTLLFYEGYY